MAKQACSACLLCEGQELDIVILDIVISFFLESHALKYSILSSYGTSRKECDKCSKQGLYTSVECSCALCVLWKKDFTDLLNKFKLVIFCFIALFSFSFYIEMTVNSYF